MTTLRELEDEFILCRTLGHAWDENPSPVVSIEWRRASHATLFVRCTRCYCERDDYLDADLEVAYRRYRYPDGYKGVMGATRRHVLRGEMLRRSLLLKRVVVRQRRAA